MEHFGSLIIILLGFVIIATASGSIAKLFLKLKLPLITGFLVVGIVAGPSVLGSSSEFVARPAVAEASPLCDRALFPALSRS